MRLSGFVVASLLLVSATLLAQHSSGGGGGGFSSGSYSGGGYSGGSSHGGSGSGGGGSSHVSSGGGSGGASSNGRTGGATAASNARAHALESVAKPEKKGFFSFLWHKKEPPKSSFCGGREGRNASGACLSSAQAHSCPKGTVWTGFGNGYCTTGYQFNDCSALASQLAAQRRHMQGQSDPGQSLFYRLLSEQYQSCLSRSSRGLWSYNNASLFDAP
jgi:hypothetical protein